MKTIKKKYVDIGDIQFLAVTSEDFAVEVDEVKLLYWKKGKGRKLIILLHASTNSAQSFCHISHVINQQWPDTDLLIPELHAGIVSTADCLIIVRDLVRWIDRFDEQEKYDSIIFVGHSLGALLARKIYICSCGETESVPFEKPLEEFKQQKAWAKKVGSCVLSVLNY